MNGNRTSVLTSSGTISYQYDALNQLTQETLLDGTAIAYQYDAAGNRTKKTVTQGSTTTTNYTYDAANQLTAVNGQAYTYDANGNLIGNGSKTFIYDVENHLIQVKKSDGTSLATFTYDQDGKRISMNTSAGTTYYHYNGDEVVYETDATNNIVTDYTWDNQGNPVTMTKGGTTYYYHVNGHGDVTSLTDSSGNIVAQYQYDAWGNIISSSGSMKDANPYRYAGYRYDNETGLYYLMARYYDPNVGRFITRDRFQGFQDDPLSLNQYAYTNNNPVMNTDPTGYLTIRKAGLIIDGVLLVLNIGAAAMGLKATIKLIKYVNKAAVKQTKKKIVALVKSSLGTVAKAVLGFTLPSINGIAAYATDLFFDMSLGKAIATAIYYLVPASRKILTK